jgi:hypothetical protein
LLLTKYVVKTEDRTVTATLIDAEDEEDARYGAGHEIERQSNTVSKTSVTLFNDGIITDEETKEVVIKTAE